MRIGDIIPAYLQLADYATGKFPSVFIYDDSFSTLGEFDLSGISNGLYGNASQEFPDSEFVILQFLTYEDSNRTTLSSSEGGQLAVFFKDGTPAGTEVVPLVVQLANYATDLFVRAVVRDDTGATIATKNLTAGANGVYYDLSVQMPASSSFVSIQYLVYTDSGYTVLSTAQGAGFGISFLSVPPSSTLPANTGLVGVLDSLLQNPINGIQDQLVTNSDRILNARIVRSDNGDPYNLTGATNVAFRFLNADETVTVIQLTDPGAPVQITSAAAGMISCSVTKAQSLFFKPMNPAPFSVVITQPGGQSICNFPYQLQISAQVNPVV